MRNTPLFIITYSKGIFERELVAYLLIICLLCQIHPPNNKLRVVFFAFCPCRSIILSVVFAPFVFPSVRDCSESSVVVATTFVRPLSSRKATVTQLIPLLMDVFSYSSVSVQKSLNPSCMELNRIARFCTNVRDFIGS